MLPRDEGDERLLRELAVKEARCLPDELAALVLQRKSIDARHGRVRLHLRFDAYIGERPAAPSYWDAHRSDPMPQPAGM